MDLSPLLSSLPFPSWSPMQVSLQGSVEEGTSAKGNPTRLGWMGRCGFCVRYGSPSCFPGQGEGGGPRASLSSGSLLLPATLAARPPRGAPRGGEGGTGSILIQEMGDTPGSPRQKEVASKAHLYPAFLPDPSEA